jgi:hypothetical protein
MRSYSGAAPQANSNTEIRSSKKIQSTNAPMFKTKAEQPAVLVI